MDTNTFRAPFSWSLRAQAALQRLPGEPGQKAHGHVLDAQIAQHGGHVDSLAAELDLFALGAVDVPGPEPIHADHVVQGGIEGDGVNHDKASYEVSGSDF